MGKNLTQIVGSRSSRNGVSPTRIVLHTTEGHNRPGVSDLTGLAWFFNGAQASSHLGIDAEGNCIRMVPDSDKAWTQAAYNPGSLSIEQVGFSATSTKEWIRDYHRGLVRVGQALAHWSIAHPQIKLHHSVANGVCQHKNLGAAGGGHHDCGAGYPERYVIYLARIHFYKHKGWNKSKNPVRRARLRAYYRYVHAVEKRYAGKRLT